MVKKNFIKHLTLVVMMLIAGVNVSHAQTNNEVTLVASGDGSTKEEATKSALRSAIEQTYGTFVSSNTKILNDKLVKDEIISISSGNIKSFKSISENQTNGKWYVTVQATVSIGKLIKYVQSKGAAAEFAGATFAMNVKMKKFYNDNQRKALENLQTQLRALFLTSFDYEINVQEPKEFNGEYIVFVKVIVKANKNAEACYDLYNITLSALSAHSPNRDKNDIILCGPNKYYIDGTLHRDALVYIESILKECICNFTLSDGLSEYIGNKKYHYGNFNVELIDQRTKFVIDSDSRPKLYRGPLLIKEGHNPYGDDKGYFLPIISNSNYAGKVVATFEFDLRYSLDKLSKISNFKIAPTRLSK